MPYLNGKRVTNEEWIRARGGNPQGIGWKEATGWQDGDDAPATPAYATDEPVEEKAPPKRRRTGGRKAAAEAAVTAATGVTVDLDTDSSDATIDAAGLMDLDATTEDEANDSDA